MPNIGFSEAIGWCPSPYSHSCAPVQQRQTRKNPMCGPTPKTGERDSCVVKIPHAGLWKVMLLQSWKWGNIHFSTLQIRKLRPREAKLLSKDAQLVCGEAGILVALGKTAKQTGLIMNTSDGKSSNSLESYLSFQPSGG